MKRGFWALLMVSSAAGSAFGQSQAEQEVLRLTQELTQAMARRDASVHERLFAEDYTYTPGNGNFMGREEHMSFTRSGALVVESLRSEDVRVRLYGGGDVAVVTGLWIGRDRRTDTERDRPVRERRTRFILVYARRAGRWQIVAQQHTAVDGRNNVRPPPTPTPPE